MQNGASKILTVVFAAVSSAVAEPSAYERDIQPVLKEFCITCHSTEKQKGDLDLERFTSLEIARRDPSVWEHALEQFGNQEMPPKDKPQPSPAQMGRLTAWMQDTLEGVARETAGDPGPVVLRRLSNMEYTYTVRDLTGVESLDPAKEFPVDGAAGEGFTNAGAALVMSPALLTKYFDAAKEIASHAVLLPKSFRFSAGDSSQDWTDELLTKIREFYGQFTIEGNAIGVDLQGIKLETNAGGRTPVAKYMTALLQERDALRAGEKSIDTVAKEHGLNGRYAGILWTGLTEGKKSEVLDQVRREFDAAAPDDPAKLIGTINDWQQSLWRFTSVGHIGKKNGPKAWQEPASPMGLQHSIRLKLEPPKDRSDLTVYLVMRDVVGEGHDLVSWEDARVVSKDLKEVMLRDVPGALPRNLTAQTPGVLEVRIPVAMITEGAEFAITAKLAPHSRDEACVQVHVLTTKPEKLTGLMASKTTSGMVKGIWTDNNLRSFHNAPLLVAEESATGKRLAAAFEDFRRLFPAALCYTKIVPVDEVVTLTLFYREDDQLKRLMLDEAQSAEIDRLWEELRFVSEAPLKEVDVFEQLWQYATQDAKPDAFEPLREPILRGAKQFREDKVMAGPRQVLAVLDFAERAWRRPLTDAEETELRSLYQKLRQQDLTHESALRMVIARVLVAPAFLYRGEKAAPGPEAKPVNDWELATRLSYFLWSSAPDDELRSLARSGKLHEASVLAAQARRMMKDARVRRLATEFGCQWLQVRDLETLDEKSERHFPTFAGLRGAMQEEVVRFFTDLFQEDQPVLALIDADYTFVNGALAEHYGIDVARHSDVGSGGASKRSDIGMSGYDWRRVEGLHAKGRGGILGFAATLAKQSGASRTSPILRGNWLTEVVLGEKLPRPPKGVPILPDEAPEGLTERQLIERHSSDATCARCHQRMDPFGFALEGFDAIGHRRAADTRATLPDGTKLEGLEGLRSYLLDRRRDDFLNQFCRKLLGYALGRGVQLSDKPLLESMLVQLKTQDEHVSTAIELIVASKQFREVRGKDYAGNP
jgi:hypothetical protein